MRPSEKKRKKSNTNLKSMRRFAAKANRKNKANKDYKGKKK